MSHHSALRSLSALLLIACSFLVACGGGDTGMSEREAINNSFDAPTTIERTIEFEVSSAFHGQSVAIATTQGVRGVDNNTATDAFLVESPRSSVAFVEDSAGNVLYPIVLRGSDQTDLNLRVDAHNIAVALVRLTPSVAALSASAFAAAEEKIAETENWDNLVGSVEEWIAEDPTTRFSFESNPHIFLGAAEIGRQILGLPAQRDLLVAPAMDLPSNRMELATLCGNPDLPHLELDFDGRLFAVNPSTNFVALQYDETVFQLIPPRTTWLDTSSFPFEIRYGEAPRVSVDPFQGPRTVGLTNGFGFVGGRAQEVARNANVIRMLQSTIGTLGPMLEGQGSLARSEAEDEQAIDRIMELAISIRGEELSSVGTTLASAIASGTSWAELSSVVATRCADGAAWDNIRAAIWGENVSWGNDPLSRAHILNANQRVQQIMGRLAPVSSAVTASDVGVPFLIDLSRIPADYSFDLNTNQNLITLMGCTTTPMATFEIERGEFGVGDQVNFDATDSVDAEDNLAELDFRWDFDGDGSYDTPFTNDPMASHTYDSRGIFAVKLEIRDTDGNRKRFVRGLEMGDDSAFKVVLTWGEDPLDLDSHLFTPVVLGSAYHVSFMSKRGPSLPPFAYLDIDDTASFGPETTWFEDVFPGTYSFYVNHLTGVGSIENSGAVVKVISRYEVIHRFTPPAGDGDWWHVFDLDGATETFTEIKLYKPEP